MVSCKGMFTYFGAMQALSPVGRCKTFDESADGYGRGEGCAVAVLQPGHTGGQPPLAVLAGSAVNQDGRSSGLTAPNGPSQSALVRGVLTRSGATLACPSATGLAL